MHLSHEQRMALKQALMGLTSEEGRIVCPVCKATHEKSLSYKREPGSILFHCFRAKCSIRGSMPTATGTLYQAPPSYGATTTTTPITQYSLSSLPKEVYLAIPVKDTSIPPLWRQDRQMVMYPILSYQGTELGYIQRHYKAVNSWWTGPKAINLPHHPDDKSLPLIHFPLLTHEKFNGTLTVVEDWPSSEAVAKYRPVCALLGTNITADTINHFIHIGVKHLIICLDADAHAKAVKLMRMCSLAFSTVNVQFIYKDPKDMTKQELEEVFGT